MRPTTNPSRLIATNPADQATSGGIWNRLGFADSIATVGEALCSSGKAVVAPETFNVANVRLLNSLEAFGHPSPPRAMKSA